MAMVLSYLSDYAGVVAGCFAPSSCSA